MTTDNLRFWFGRNWNNYVQQHFSDERVEISRRHLLSFLKLDSLEGKSFLDIGSGSGLHSMAAWRAGAKGVTSFDFDDDSVETTRGLKELAGNPANWRVTQGSILDKSFLATLEPADIVYAWGVLHHTGDMWQAMDNTAPLIRPGGLLYVALYDYEAHVDPPAEFWLEVKQRYNRSGRWGRRKMEWWYVWRFVMRRNILRLPELIWRIVGYKHARGMAFYTDIVDWLGGWPMEFAKRGDVKSWAERQKLDIVAMKTDGAATEYVFRRPQAA